MAPVKTTRFELFQKVSRRQKPMSRNALKFVEFQRPPHVDVRIGPQADAIFACVQALSPARTARSLFQRNGQKARSKLGLGGKAHCFIAKSVVLITAGARLSRHLRGGGATSNTPFRPPR
ncbi:hypothetical protein EVAR_31281_1 [Eumeta japonica]|uniref:Uncharacterized protein n=1 Tax=Eumeta variegata TaxID=151549 RepID=A0A4C1VPU3_EUMVA|nr:hypothetical protein EVAR_31281_1 [Eumeta japonica]